MKTYTHLFEQITSFENLFDAWLMARKHKRRTDQAARFEVHLEMELGRLHYELTTLKYKPLRYKLFFISDPKRRLIAAAPFRDRVVHHAIVQVLAKTYQRSFIDHSFACLTGRGSHRAILHFLGNIRRYPYFIKLDMVKYFPSLSWDIILQLLRAKTTDERFLKLITVLLESGAHLYESERVAHYLGTDYIVKPRHGLPIGNYTSQWFGNFYLDGFDHFAKRELHIHGYHRYMDDITLFGNSRHELSAIRDAAIEWLAAHRELSVHVEKAHIQQCRDPHVYLGYTVSQRGIYPSARMKKRFKQRLSTLWYEDIETITKVYASYVAAFLF